MVISMRLSALCMIGLMTSVAVTPSSAATCSFIAETSALPITSGRMVYKSVDEAGGTAQLYMYDFGSPNVPPKPIIPADGIMQLTYDDQPGNPKFSPDGSGIIFSAVTGVTSDSKSGQRDLFYSPISKPSGTFKKFYNLTANLTKKLGSRGFGGFDDAQFSPAGNRITWKWRVPGPDSSKFYYEIVIANVVPNSAGIPHLQGPITRVSPIGEGGTNKEPSGPTFSLDGSHIYFWTGTGDTDSQNKPVRTMLWKYSLSPVARDQVGFGQQTSKFYYWYPAVHKMGAIEELFYVRQRFDNPKPGTDLVNNIFNYSSDSGSTVEWYRKDCADNADPAPVVDDYFIYARLEGTYVLYLGQLSTGKAWALPALKATADGPISGNILGANYTSVVQSTTNPH